MHCLCQRAAHKLNPGLHLTVLSYYNVKVKFFSELIKMTSFKIIVFRIVLYYKYNKTLKI
jgi:hypothetical protein